MLQKDHQTLAKNTLLYSYLVIFSLICVKLFFVVTEEKSTCSRLNFKEIAINDIDHNLLV